MDDQTIYYDDGVARVIRILRDTFGDFFKNYYNGEPPEIPPQDMPCVIVSETDGSIEDGATGQDNITETIRITLSVDLREYANASDDTNMAEYHLRKLVKGQDPTTLEYLPETVMYAIRKHHTINDRATSNTVRTEFAIAERAENFYAQEAYVTLTITRRAMVPERD